TEWCRCRSTDSSSPPAEVKSGSDWCRKIRRPWATFRTWSSLPTVGPTRTAMSEASSTTSTSSMACGEDPVTLAAGSRLGPYEIVAPLGAGGMGEVYRAKDSRRGREGAIKVLPAARASEPESVKRLVKEAGTSGALKR